MLKSHEEPEATLLHLPTAGETSAEAWARLRRRLRSELGEDKYQSWFSAVQLDSLVGNRVVLSAPTNFLKSWINKHFAERLTVLWQELVPTVQRVDIVVRSTTGRQTPKARIEARPETRIEARPESAFRPAQAPAEAPAPAALPAAVAQPAPLPAPMPAATLPAATGETLGGIALDPRLTFETYHVGRPNQLAHAAAREVAFAKPTDKVMFNPLFVHSAVGLGKTHLLQAIAHAGNTHRTRRIAYLTAETFVFRYVAALKAQTAVAFKEWLRSIDVLVIDDVQFLQGKQSQNEFCHTINALIDSGKQVVVAADRPPGELENLDERVRSRLAGGLVVEVFGLDEDLRLKMLQARVDAARAQLPGFDVPKDVLQHVARQVTQNGRDLDGAFNRLLAHSRLTNQTITLEVAEHAIRDLVKPSEPKKIRIEDIQRIVAKQYNVSRQDLISERRTANVVKPRQIAMYLSKTLTPRSYPEIGRRFGGRDHTTVLHAVRKIDKLIVEDTRINEEVEMLRRLLQEQA